MGGINVELFLLVLIFKVALGDIDFSQITCKDVTGYVGKELTLHCTVIYSDRCKATNYKFYKDEDTTICREEFKTKSKQQHFSCPYTPNKAMTTKLYFFLQADCGTANTSFTVNTAGTFKVHETMLAGPEKRIGTSVLTDLSATCKDVTGHVGKELTLHCTVIYSDRCKATNYKFYNKDKGTTIFREKFNIKFKQQHFSCSYTPNDTTTKLHFFLQADCGTVNAPFTVNTAGRLMDPPIETSVLTDNIGIPVIMAAVSCFIIFIMGFVLIRKHNAKKTSGFQNKVFMCDNI